MAIEHSHAWLSDVEPPAWCLLFTEAPMAVVHEVLDVEAESHAADRRGLRVQHRSGLASG
jgi:hypothetical protein